MERVKYYPSNNWAGGHNLEISENIILSFDSKNDYDINDILEFFNISKYFDNKIYLTKWDKTTINSFIKIIKEMKKKVMSFFNQKINNISFIDEYKKVDLQYKNDFFELLSLCKTIDISENQIAKLLDEVQQIRITDLLEHRKLVEKYGNTIRNYLINNADVSAPIIIDYYFVEKQNNKKMYVSLCLSLEDKENILLKYIESPYANLNYIRIITEIQSNKDFIEISDKTKLKAVKREKELEKELFNNSNTIIEYGFGVDIDDNQIETVISKTDNKNNNIFSYSGKWISGNLDYQTLLNNFIYMFEFVDKYFRIELVNKRNDSDFFEMLGLKSKYSYNPNTVFKNRSSIAFLQITSYYNYLKRFNIRLEDIIEWFFKEYLSEKYGVNNYIINTPSKESNYFEKCKTILPEIDFVLKQFKSYCENKEIDQELIQLSSTHMFFKDIPSLNEKKYIYACDNEDTSTIQHCLFSNQCLLSYNHVLNKSYESFCERLEKENVKYSDYNSYEQKQINFLVDKEILSVKNDLVKIKNESLVRLYGDLYFNKVISYWHYPSKIRNIIDCLIDEKRLYFENSLFSKPEQDYFNYYLNKSEFNDGLDIRNLNLHGTQVGDKNSTIHFNKYMIILQLLILIIIKIDDDFQIYDDFNNQSKN